jgi:hypothetical protein
MLIQVQNITAVVEEEVGNGYNYTRLVLAVDQQYGGSGCAVIHSMFKVGW